MEHIVINGSVHTGCKQYQRVCTQICMQMGLRVLCEWGLRHHCRVSFVWPLRSLRRHSQKTRSKLCYEGPSGSCTFLQGFFCPKSPLVSFPEIFVGAKHSAQNSQFKDTHDVHPEGRKCSPKRLTMRAKNSDLHVSMSNCRSQIRKDVCQVMYPVWDPGTFFHTEVIHQKGNVASNCTVLCTTLSYYLL